LFICALGVSAVPGAELITRPFRPYLPRKHASDAPVGPAPTIRRSVSSVVDDEEEDTKPLLEEEYLEVMLAMVINIALGQSQQDVDTFLKF
jgi:hypothetical protein